MTDKVLNGKEIADVLGYSYNTLKDYRQKDSELIRGLKIFKLCSCGKRKDGQSCNHGFFAFESDIESFLVGRRDKAAA